MSESQHQAHSLRIRCPTWEHLENFYERKIKDDNILLARVPFAPASGSNIQVTLELPSGALFEIDATVDAVKQAPDGRKSAIRMVLDYDASRRAELVEAVRTGRGGRGRSKPLSVAPPMVARTQTGVPLPIPADVPIDEEVVALRLPEPEEVPAQSRELYARLHAELHAFREKAVHEVLGVEWDASVEDIRKAYFQLAKRYHPDVVARSGSPEVSFIASEIFIYINKAYDRFRESAVAAGHAIAAGPALLPHKGWLASFEDLGSVRPRRPLRSDDFSVPIAVPVDSDAMAPMSAEPVESDLSDAVPILLDAPRGSGDGTLDEASVPSPAALGADELFQDARTTNSGMEPLDEAERKERAASSELSAEALRADADRCLGEGDYEEGRRLLAELLELQPRDRNARALYHAAYGHTLMARGKPVEAMTQFEVALKHDPECAIAKDVRGSTANTRRRRPSLFKRLFRR